MVIYNFVINLVNLKMMVNSSSPAYKFSEKVVLVIEKSLRYIVVGVIISFITGKL
jgi:hypothetical protein